MKKNLSLIILLFCAMSVTAQETPETIVQAYVSMLNDYLSNPNDHQKKETLENILKPAGKKCTMKDEIVEK